MTEHSRAGPTPTAYFNRPSPSWEADPDDHQDRRSGHFSNGCETREDVGRSGADGTEAPTTYAVAGEFDDLLAANRSFAASFALGGFDGVAHAGVAVVTCMDSRIDPLGMLGLQPGDAKILRNPGGRVTDAALDALVMGVHLLGVKRILVVPHTKSAMATYTENELRRQVSESSGQDASWLSFGVIGDQLASLHDDVRQVRSHPLIPSSVPVGGFMYDVDTGVMTQKF